MPARQVYGIRSTCDSNRREQQTQLIQTECVRWEQVPANINAKQEYDKHMATVGVDVKSVWAAAPTTLLHFLASTKRIAGSVYRTAGKRARQLESIYGTRWAKQHIKLNTGELVLVQPTRVA